MLPGQDAAREEVLGQGHGVAQRKDIEAVDVSEVAHLHDGDRVGHTAVGAHAEDGFVFQRLAVFAFARAGGNLVHVLATHGAVAAACAANLVFFPGLGPKRRRHFSGFKIFCVIAKAGSPVDHPVVRAVSGGHVLLEFVLGKELPVQAGQLLEGLGVGQGHGMVADNHDGFQVLGPEHSAAASGGRGVFVDDGRGEADQVFSGLADAGHGRVLTVFGQEQVGCFPGVLAPQVRGIMQLRRFRGDQQVAGLCGAAGDDELVCAGPFHDRGEAFAGVAVAKDAGIGREGGHLHPAGHAQHRSGQGAGGDAVDVVRAQRVKARRDAVEKDLGIESASAQKGQGQFAGQALGAQGSCRQIDIKDASGPAVHKRLLRQRF